MPGEKKNFFELLISIIGIIGSLLVFLNSYFHNNFFLAKQEAIINYQEENKKEEEIQKEITARLIFLDNVISIIIFLLIFLAALLLVFYSDYSPVVENNQRNTIKKNETENDFVRSIFRKIGIFEGQIFYEKEYALYFYDANKYNVENNNIQKNNNTGENLNFLYTVYDKNVNTYGSNFQFLITKPNYQYPKLSKEDKFNFDNYQGKLIMIKDRKEVPRLTSLIFEAVSSNNDLKEKFFHKINEVHHEIIEERNLNYLRPRMREFYSADNFDASYQKFFECLQGKTNFFNFLNIFAFLFSYGLFLLSFYLPFFVFYFLYAFVYFDEEGIKEEENKFLLAFYKTLKAVLFLNLQDFFKIIPILCLLGSFFFSGYFFFGNSKFIPIIYDIRDPNVKITINLYRRGNLIKKLLKGKKVEILVKKNQEPPFLVSWKKPLSDPNENIQ